MRCVRRQNRFHGKPSRNILALLDERIRSWRKQVRKIGVPAVKNHGGRVQPGKLAG
jgi:hypothetical protein